MQRRNLALAGTAWLLLAITVQAQVPAPARTAASAVPSAAPVAPPVSAPVANAPEGASPHGRYGIRFTPGWADMTSQERDEHRTRMLNARTADGCRKVHAEHQKYLSELGRTPLTRPDRDPCAGMP